MEVSEGVFVNGFRRFALLDFSGVYDVHVIAGP